MPQRPYVWSQMTDSGLPSCQPPYFLPSAQTSFGPLGTDLGTDLATSGISTRGGR
jgi:hypothetical protein